MSSSVGEIFKWMFTVLFAMLILSFGVLGYNVSQINDYNSRVEQLIERNGGVTNVKIKVSGDSTDQPIYTQNVQKICNTDISEQYHGMFTVAPAPNATGIGNEKAKIPSLKELNGPDPDSVIQKIPDPVARKKAKEVQQEVEAEIKKKQNKAEDKIKALYNAQIANASDSDRKQLEADRDAKVKQIEDEPFNYPDKKYPSEAKKQYDHGRFDSHPSAHDKAYAEAIDNYYTNKKGYWQDNDGYYYATDNGGANNYGRIIKYYIKIKIPIISAFTRDKPLEKTFIYYTTSELAKNDLQDDD